MFFNQWLVHISENHAGEHMKKQSNRTLPAVPATAKASGKSVTQTKTTLSLTKWTATELSQQEGDWLRRSFAAGRQGGGFLLHAATHWICISRVSEKRYTHHQTAVEGVKVTVAPNHLQHTQRRLTFVLLIFISSFFLKNIFGISFTCQLFSDETPLWTRMMYSWDKNDKVSCVILGNVSVGVMWRPQGSAWDSQTATWTLSYCWKSLFQK